MQFRLLGNLEMARCDQGEKLVLPPKLRTMLSCLLVQCDQVLSIDRIVDELWPQASPNTVLATIQTYVYQLRKLLAFDGGADAGTFAGTTVIHTEGLGYRLVTPREHIDVFTFESCVRAGQEAFDRGDYERAARSLRSGLSLWSGSALSDVPKGHLLQAFVVQLEEARVQAHELLAESGLRLGRHFDVIRDMKALTVAHPLHEGFHAKLMVALGRSGRRHEALGAYTALRQILVDELGLEPSGYVRELQQAILTEDPRLAPVREELVAGTPRPLSVPAQLIGDISDFVGRERELVVVDDAVHASAAEAVRVVSVTGPPGVGKTAFTLHCAHRLRSVFPDGQFFAMLRRGSTNSVHPYLVLGEFLTAIGYLGDRLPDSTEMRSQLFRSWCADRRVLVVLDDATSVGQLRPLLPGGSGCAVLVSSGAVLHGVSSTRIDLRPLAPRAAASLLGSSIGRRLTRDEAPAVEEVVELCQRLPLALRAIGAKIAGLHLSLDHAVHLLSDPRLRLDRLSCCGDIDLRGRIDNSIRVLRPESRDALMTLAARIHDEMCVEEALAEIGPSAHRAELILNDLTDRHLVVLVPTAEGKVVATMSELTRAFLLERIEVPGPDALMRSRSRALAAAVQL